MTRRALAALLLAAVLAVAALTPWTITSERLKDHVVRQIKDGYGIDAVIGGKAVVSLLPVPRVKLQSVTLAERTGALRVEAAQIKGELKLLSLLSGSVQLADLRIASARITVALDKASGASSIERLRARLASDVAAGSRVDRLVVSGSEIVVDDRIHDRRSE